MASRLQEAPGRRYPQGPMARIAPTALTAFAIVSKSSEIKDPPIAQFLFGSTKMAVVWLLVRLWVGYEWFEAGMHKVTDPKWTQTGEALKGYWTNAAKIPEAPARAAITF